MNLISYLKAHMHNKLLLVTLTTLLSCFSTINSMELTKTQPPLLQKLSALSKDPEVRRVAKIVAIGAGVCAVALSLKKLLQSPEPAANPALITAQPQPAQAAASPVVTQASSDSASGVEISSEQRTVNEAIDLLLDQHSKASWGDQGSIKTNLFSILVLSNSLAVDRSGYTPWLSQQVRAKEDLNTFAKTAREKGLAVAIHTLGELMSKRGDTRSPYAYAYTKNLWEPGKPIIIPAEDRMIRDQLPRNTILDR